jgi:hypothetical protein
MIMYVENNISSTQKVKLEMPLEKFKIKISTSIVKIQS